MRHGRETRRILGPFAVAVCVVIVALITLPAAANGATAPAADVATPTNPWYGQRTADSLAQLTADASLLEPSVQKILDDLGTGLDAMTDLLPNEFFYTLSGCAFVEVVAEYSSDANINTIGWYEPGNTSVVHGILPGSAGPGDTTYLALEGADSIALRLYHPPYAYWYSEQKFNFDGKPHVKFYPTGDPRAFLMFWEDLPYLSDADFNDMVAILHLPAGIPTVVCTPPQTVTFCDTTALCIAFTATLEGADSVTVEILVDGQVETRVVASGVEDSVCIPVTQTDEYSIAIMPVDACGLGEVCASGFIVTVNEPPSITVRDTSLFLCDFEWVCVPYEISDPEGSDGLIVSVVSGSGSIDTVHNKIVVSGSAGTKINIVRVTDPCGAWAEDTLTVVVTRNQPPTIVVGDGAPAFQCDPGEFCIDYTVSDPDGLAGLTEEIISGPPGVSIDTAVNRICFLPDTSGTYTIVAQVTDTCGATGRDTSTVIVTANDPPTITLGNDTTINQCAAAPICVGYVVSDPDGLDGLTETHVAGPGVIDTAANTICFTPDVSGTYTIVAQVSDPCLETDVDTMLVHVNVNMPPSLTLDDDAAIFLCAPEVICVGYVVTDPDGTAGLAEVLVAGPAGATIDTVADQVCFTPTATGLYTIIATVTDSCDLTDVDTVQVDVTINSVPTISLNNGVPVFQCEPGALCIPYDVADADGLTGLTEMLLVGPGAIDTLTNEICFTPDTTGTYTFVAQVTDSCGAFDTDTIAVYAETNGPPTITFGDDEQINQCLPAAICIPYDLDDPNGLAGLTETLVAGPGTFDTVGNQICFVPDTSGSYTFIVSVSDPCGETDADTIVVSVTLNRPPTVAFGDEPVDVFLCSPEEICVTYEVDDPDGLAGLTEMLPVDAAPPGGGGGDLDAMALIVDGAYIDTVANRVCFLPDTSGIYCLAVEVRDTCGAKDADTIC
ncbi:MAG TPA: hypothetical protein VM118_01950, partial [Acidobacteriota bacterium]|nr:hypothetical protein [Acidobacteriota bacterium]